MILSSACQQWPADQPGPAGKASRPSLSYTTLWDTICVSPDVESFRDPAIADNPFSMQLMDHRADGRGEAIGLRDGGRPPPSRGHPGLTRLPSLVPVALRALRAAFVRSEMSLRSFSASAA